MTALPNNIQISAPAQAVVACARLAVAKESAQAETVAYWHFGYGYFSQEPGCL